MKKIPQLLLVAIGLLVSCNDETIVFENPQGDIRLETNQQILDNSIRYDNSGVLGVSEQEKVSGKWSKSGSNDVAGNYPLTLVAQINPPSFAGGENLTASHVHLEGDYAYVSYNTVEDGYAGGVDIINVSDPHNPIISARLYYLNADVNSLKYDSGYVYAVGGVDAELSVRATSNAFIAKIPVSSGRFNIDAITYAFQQGFVSTDVETTATTVLVTSGQDGSLTIYNKNKLEIIQEIPFSDLRSIALKDNKIAMLDGSKGIIKLDENYSTTGSISIDSDFGIAKRTIDFLGDNIIVSEGAKGAGIYNFATGTLQEHLPILINPSNVASQDIVTNAIAANENILFMANGGAGLSLSENEANNADVVGILELEGSINYVASKKDYVFAASGKKGLQIVKLNKPSESLVNRCGTLTTYQGSANLNVNTGQSLAYKGSKSFNTINVNGSLLLCGSWTTNNTVNINSNGLFEMNGTLVVAKNNNRRNFSINQGATLKVEGNLTVYGDLVLNNGATIEFIGEDSVVNIFGAVRKSGDVVIKGNFRDVQNKF